MDKRELGTCNAIISGISTLKDLSVKLTLEINPEDQNLINRLMKCYLEGDSLVTVAFVKAENG